MQILLGVFAGPSEDKPLEGVEDSVRNALQSVPTCNCLWLTRTPASTPARKEAQVDFTCAVCLTVFCHSVKVPVAKQKCQPGCRQQ